MSPQCELQLKMGGVAERDQHDASHVRGKDEHGKHEQIKSGQADRHGQKQTGVTAL